jgi:lipoyl-dependent peroxiredoxin
MSLAAAKGKVALPPDHAVDTAVDLGMSGDAYLLQARLNVHVPGVPPEIAQTLVDTAHQTCPYSRATHGNLNVEISLA